MAGAASRRARGGGGALSLPLAAAVVLVAAAALAPATSASGLPARVIPLTDANFEHDTQASTGQTTGHWAVLLSDSSAAKTQPAARIAQKALAALAASRAAADDGDDADGDAHDPGCLYASVDASDEVNPALAARFRAFLPGPVLLLFRDRQMFPLPLPRVMLSQQQLDRAGAGQGRSDEQAVSAAYHAILEFLSGGFREVDSERIPPPGGAGGAGGGGGGGLVDRAINFLAAQTADLDGDHLMAIGVAAVVVGGVLFVGFIGVAVAFASGVGVKAGPLPPTLAAAAEGAAAAAAAGKKASKPAPVPEEKEEEEEEEEDKKEEDDDAAEEVAAKGEEEEQEEDEAAAGGAALRRRRRRA